ncbi:MAG: putative zinc protease [Ignavibacteria bacterium]|nr:putative zinc protease [Ignavibacteria bacterium]
MKSLGLKKVSENLTNDFPAIEYREYILKNGLKVVLCNTGNIPIAAVNTTYHTGSRDEIVGKTGLAHLIEHLMFEGSPNIPRGKFDEILAKNGGESNAYTTRDFTSYFISVPSSHLETAFWLDSDRLSGFGITNESLEIQKDVIIEEKLMYNDNSPYGSLDEEISKRLYDGTNYSWPVIGKMDDIRNMNLKDVEDFYNKHYTPSNTVISVTGDIEYERTIELIEKYYGEIFCSLNETKTEIYPKKITKETSAYIKDDIHLEGKFIFYQIPPAGTKEFYSFKILSGILSSGESSRFFQELEYKNNLVHEADSSAFSYEKSGVFMISAIALKGKDMQIIENKINGIIEDIISGNINDREFNKIINRLETRFSSRLQSIVGLSDRFSYLKTIHNDCSKINFEINDYLVLTKKDISDAAGKYLNQNQRIVLNYIPK